MNNIERNKRIFNGFLKKESLHNNYYLNHLNDRETVSAWIRGPFDSFFDTVDPLDYLGLGFIWASTREGHFFWNAISDKWKRYYKTYGFALNANTTII